MNNDLQKAVQLIQLHKYSQAIKELDVFLQGEPNHARAYALKADVYVAKRQTKEAIENAQKAVGLAPDDPFVHYILGIVHLNLTKEYKQAEFSMKEALRLDPQDVDYYEALARIKMIQKKYSEALRLCEEGLKISPENSDCRSTKAQVLTKLGQRETASLDIKQALKNNPEDPNTLATAGWMHLENNAHSEALELFTQALKVQPDHEHARDGLIQALKARNFVFRQYLKYIFWVGKLNPRTRLFLVFGVLFLVRLMRQWPITIPIVVLYGLFAISTWIIDPIFNLFLRFNKYGKYALTKIDIIASNLVASCLILAILLGIAAIFVDVLIVVVAIAVFLMMIPISGTAALHSAKPSLYKKAMIFTSVLCITIVLGFGMFPFFKDVGIIILAITIVGQMLFSRFFVLVA